jgi:hypothetical protein
MKEHQIARAKVFGTTPEVVKQRLTHTLNNLKEEEPMKKHISAQVIVLVILALLTGVAYAAVSGGMQWYLKNRFDYSGNLPKDLDQRIQSNIKQSGENPMANVTIDGVAWLGKGLGNDNPQLETLDINIRASIKEPDKYEMVNGWSIDVDGARGDEERREHPKYGNRADEAWLWAYDTYGPIDAVMKDPKKQLILYDYSCDNNIWVPGASFMLTRDHWDMLEDDQTGEVICNYSYGLSEAQMKDLRKLADSEGYVTFMYESRVSVYADEYANGNLSAAPIIGTITFSVKLP